MMYPSYLDGYDPSPYERIQGLHSDVYLAIDELGQMYEEAMEQVSTRVSASLKKAAPDNPDLLQQAIEAARVQLTQAHLAAVGQVLEAAGGDVVRALRRS